MLLFVCFYIIANSIPEILSVCVFYYFLINLSAVCGYKVVPLNPAWSGLNTIIFASVQVGRKFLGLRISPSFEQRGCSQALVFLPLRTGCLSSSSIPSKVGFSSGGEVAVEETR